MITSVVPLLRKKCYRQEEDQTVEMRATIQERERIIVVTIIIAVLPHHRHRLKEEAVLEKQRIIVIAVEEKEVEWKRREVTEVDSNKITIALLQIKQYQGGRKLVKVLKIIAIITVVELEGGDSRSYLDLSSFK